MPTKRLIVGTLAVAMAAFASHVTAAAQSDRVVPLTNASFEAAAASGLPVGWHLAAPLPPGSRARQDEGTAHAGAKSVLLANGSPASLTLVSEPVTLAVGRVYRLSAWIKSKGALSDAASRYPTAVPACLTMLSFPFTNHSAAVGADNDWTRVETLFVATKSRDAVRLHLGYNGTAVGTAWFDDVRLEELDDITAFIPMEIVRWAGNAYRYDDRGWIFVHTEGAPYERGFAFGTLVADEIAEYIKKLSLAESVKDPAYGWATLRELADATMLRGFDEEFLTEMKGTADGAAKAGAKVDGRQVDLLDIVTVNSVIDLGQLKGALRVTKNALSGSSFLSPEEEAALPDRLHKCSSFVATHPATADGRIVFGQIFMWSGYTGTHFNILLDVQPSTGHRLIYQTFPGGIHSGTDFYINAAGIVIGETTVGQTPFNAAGTPQSNRVRKAAQYASSIDDVARLLRERSNGLYTNDWPIADVKTDEGAILLLGTAASKLWRSSTVPAPFGTPGFLWSNNNPRELEVRKEYVANADNAPVDLVFSPWNRDIAFNEFYRTKRGAIDSIAAVNLWASSPINRAHACDGKITTSEMAEKLVFLAHFGKVTLREKFPQAGSRRMPDLPGAIPHLTLGYSAASPIVVGNQLKAARARASAVAKEVKEPPLNVAEVAERYAVDKKRLWRNTVVPASDAEGWLASGSAAYWTLLNNLPDDGDKAARTLRDQLADLDDRLLYLLAHEEDIAPVKARTVYDRYGNYQIPRIKGTFALHQLRLLLGNERFLKVMNALYARFAGSTLDNAGFIRTASAAAGRDLGDFIGQWIERTGLPDPRPSVRVKRTGAGWRLRVDVAQPAPAYHLLGAIAVDVGSARVLRPVEITGERSSAEFAFSERPTRVAFNFGNDIPVRHERFYTWANYSDDFGHALIVHGTAREDEANRTLALRWQTTLADAFAETLSPVVKDCEVSPADLASHDLIVLGLAEDNTVLAHMAAALPVTVGKNWFRWQGRNYTRSDDGLFLVVPNPYNRERVLYLILANSALELHEMTKAHSAAIPSWAVFKGSEIRDQGYHVVERFVFDQLSE
jgi:hypothetical protein